jgi:large subunit ribosomal protein L10
VARVLVDYAKENEKLQVKGGVADGEIVDLAAVRVLAALPTKHELRGMLAGTVQAPLRNLAGTMYALLGHLRNALEQRQGQLED